MSNKTDRKNRSRVTSLLLSGARPFAVALAAALLGACAQGSPAEQTEQSGDAVQTLERLAGIHQEGDVLGSPNAPVTLEEFSDLRCSHCRDFVDHTLPVLLDRYVRSGRLRIVFHNLPILGTPSVQAARMAAAMGLQGHEYEFIDLFFHRTPGPVTDDVLRQLASQIPGVDVDAAMAQRSSPAVDAVIEESRKLAHRFSVDGTPTFLLGKTGETPHVVSTARARQPETITAPIDEMLGHHDHHD